VRWCLWAALGAALVVAPGCGTTRAGSEPIVIDGQSFGVTTVPFRGRWWHYYERGVSWASGGFWAEAEADFRAARRLRQSDSRRARTYSMRFVQCFVNRELAWVLIQQGHRDEARPYLMASLDAEPSAKAVYLLEQLDGAEAVADQLPLAPDLPEPAPLAAEVVVTEAAPAANEALAVQGRVLADASAQLWALAADGSVRLLELAADGAFAAELAAGERLAVADTAAGAAETSLVTSVSEPPAAPELTVADPADGAVLYGEQIWLRYSARAAAGLTRLRVLDAQGEVASREIAQRDLAGIEQGGTWSLALAPGQHHLRFVLEDSAGTSVELSRSVDVRAPVATQRAWRAPALLVPLQAPRDGLPVTEEDDARYAAALLSDGRFRYIDQRADDVLTRELALVDAGHLDRLTAAEAGRRLEARYVLAGTMRRGHHELECYLRLIHADSGKVVATADAYAAGPEAAVPEQFFAATAGRLRQVFPVLQAQLLRDSSLTHIDLGERDGVHKRMLFHVIRTEGELRDKATGEVLLAGEKRIVTSGEVVAVEAHRSELAIDPEALPAETAELEVVSE
jgi:hypothetical protein